jgi:hypothetical protein
MAVTVPNKRAQAARCSEESDGKDAAMESESGDDGKKS